MSHTELSFLKGFSWLEHSDNYLGLAITISSLYTGPRKIFWLQVRTSIILSTIKCSSSPAKRHLFHGKQNNMNTTPWNWKAYQTLGSRDYVIEISGNRLVYLKKNMHMEVCFVFFNGLVNIEHVFFHTYYCL